MIEDLWPLFGLVLRTPRLELRLPSAGQLAELGELAAEGVHDPAVMPFTVAWTDAAPLERARSTLQFQWRTWAELTPANWKLNLVVLEGGRVVGSQELAARDFAVTREVETGSWLGRRHHGGGIGTEMRAAVLHLAFAGLGAQLARSAAALDNPASRAVSGKLGYAEDGTERVAVRGVASDHVRFRLDRAGWEAHRTVPVEIIGLEPCLSQLGVAPTA